MSSCPEHDKMKSLRVESQTVGNFIDWLSQVEHVHLCLHDEDQYVCEECGVITQEEVRYARGLGAEMSCRKCRTNEVKNLVEFRPEGYYPYHYNRIESLIAKFLEIDLTKIDNEKRAMLDGLRAHNAGITSISDV